jgi:hypothetical protein
MNISGGHPLFTAHWRRLRCGGKVDVVATAAVPFVSVNLKVWTSWFRDGKNWAKRTWGFKKAWLYLGDLARSSKIGDFTPNFWLSRINMEINLTGFNHPK